MRKIRSSKLDKNLDSDKKIVIDVRSKQEFMRSHIPDSYNIPSDLLLKHVVQYLNKEYIYYILCEDGTRSEKVCKQLDKLNYQVINVKGGIRKYKGGLNSHSASEAN